MAEAIPNWITAIVAALALGAAVWAAVTASRVYKIEKARDRDRELVQDRQQADLVAGWVSWTDQPRVALKLPDGRTSRANLALQNGSAVPVYDVMIVFFEGGGVLGEQSFHLLSPTGTAAHHREIKCPGVAELLAQPRSADHRLDIRVAISFTDARGVRWTREASGQLIRSLD